MVVVVGVVRWGVPRMQETLRLDMDDEAAVEWMQQLLTESATALMPQIMETGHK